MVECPRTRRTERQMVRCCEGSPAEARFARKALSAYPHEDEAEQREGCILVRRARGRQVLHALRDQAEHESTELGGDDSQPERQLSSRWPRRPGLTFQAHKSRQIKITPTMVPPRSKKTHTAAAA